MPLVFGHRIAGLGSLGRQRYVALGDWRGGRIAREAKPIVPSAAVWAGLAKDCTGILYQQILDKSVRCLDPFVHMEGNWIVRRLSPDCSRIELNSLPIRRDEMRLLYSMGWETANVHLGTAGAQSRIVADLKKRDSIWLLKAARQMSKAVSADWKAWGAASSK